MSDRQFEHSVRAWLEAGSDRTPRPAIDAVLLAVKTTPQERDLRIPRRFNQMTNSMRLLAAVAIVAIAGVGALALANRGPGTGGILPTTPLPTTLTTPSPAPSASAAAIDTSAWVTYASERYGFDIKRPPSWTERPSDHVWRLPQDVDWENTASESYIGFPGDEFAPADGLRVSAWSIAIDRLLSLDEWIATYCPLNTMPCTGLKARSVPAEVDGHAGVQVSFAGETQAFFRIDGRVYVFVVWRPGYERLLDAFLSTVTLRPGGPAPQDTVGPSRS